MSYLDPRLFLSFYEGPSSGSLVPGRIGYGNVRSYTDVFHDLKFYT